MISEDPPLERVDELLADLALQGLTPAEAAELAHLVEDLKAESLSLELAIAEAEVALGDDPGELPDTLKTRLESLADTHFSTPKRSRTVGPVVAGSVPWLGWITAAAALVFAIADRQVPPKPIGPIRQPTLAERFAGLASRPLSATDHPLAKGGSGTLIWSPEQQEGYLKIQGLAETDPAKGVYQLWIFDATRDDRFPVDGGTFAIADATATSLIPIRPRLEIRQPTLFAVTLEPPGGVVVSDRKRILLTTQKTP